MDSENQSWVPSSWRKIPPRAAGVWESLISLPVRPRTVKSVPVCWGSVPFVQTAWSERQGLRVKAAAEMKSFCSFVFWEQDYGNDEIGTCS